MKYEFKPTWGLPLYYGSKPYRKVINNGCTIETQDEILIEQLISNESRRSSQPIDWWLFKVGETILTDNLGRKFACSMNNNGKWIQLDRIIGE